MKTLNRVKTVNVFCIVLMLLFCLPEGSMAQRFNHGGGGGRGGGGARGGGGGFRGGGGARQPMQVFGGGRSINGGGRNIGNHIFHGPSVHYNHPYGGIRHNEGVFHHGFGYHPYFYHPYHPYIWGPYWHPFGFFAATLTADAILLSIADRQYYYDNGVYYAPYGRGYTVVPPPVGAVVSYLPQGYENVQVGDAVYYYYGGAFYVSQGGSFRVVPAPPGAIVTEIPEGATEQVINGENYLLYNNTYYLPISQDGQDAYEVVQIN